MEKFDTHLLTPKVRKWRLRALALSLALSWILVGCHAYDQSVVLRTVPAAHADISNRLHKLENQLQRLEQETVRFQPTATARRFLVTREGSAAIDQRTTHLIQLSQSGPSLAIRYRNFEQQEFPAFDKTERVAHVEILAMNNLNANAKGAEDATRLGNWVLREKVDVRELTALGYSFDLQYVNPEFLVIEFFRRPELQLEGMVASN